ncbi:MAG: tetratricopeptide repeat protein [Elusimicrobia bacterium]|nr:tetratricopeptide repeat protein [Elusimicrobiota bacterium]
METVAWTIERGGALCGLFYLAAADAYLRDPARRARVLGLYVLALLSKVSAISLPATLLVLDAFALGRLRTEPRRALLEKLPFLLIALAAAAVAVAAKAQWGGLRTTAQVEPAMRFALAAYAYPYYIAKTLMPWPLQPFHRVPEGLGPLSWPVALAASASAVLVWAAVRGRRRTPAVLAALAHYSAAAAPLLGVVTVGDQLVAERYSYLPALGPSVAAGAGLSLLVRSRRTRPWAISLAAVVCAALGRASWSRTAQWRDSRTLWTHALAVDPGNAVAHNQYAAVLAEAGELARAERHVQEAVRLDPRNLSARLNWAAARLGAGDLAAAQEHAEAAIRINSRSADAYEFLGAVRARQGRLPDSAELRRAALRLDPSHRRARYNLAVVLAAAGSVSEAEAAYRESIRLDPRNPDAHNNLGLLLAGRGEARAAAEEYRQALRLRPDHAPAHLNWAALNAQEGRLAAAERHVREVLRRNPAHPVAREYLAKLRAARPR